MNKFDDELAVGWSKATKGATMEGLIYEVTGVIPLVFVFEILSKSL